MFTCIETEIITSVKPGSSGFNSSNRVSVKVQSLKHKHNQVNTKLLTFEPLIQIFYFFHVGKESYCQISMISPHLTFCWWGFLVAETNYQTKEIHIHILYLGLCLWEGTSFITLLSCQQRYCILPCHRHFVYLCAARNCQKSTKIIFLFTICGPE